jgi:hypothetical protein
VEAWESLRKAEAPESAETVMPVAVRSSSEEEARAIAPEFKLKAISVKLEESAFREFKPAEIWEFAFEFWMVFPGFFQTFPKSFKIEPFE